MIGFVGAAAVVWPVYLTKVSYFGNTYITVYVTVMYYGLWPNHNFGVHFCSTLLPHFVFTPDRYGHVIKRVHVRGAGSFGFGV